MTGIPDEDGRSDPDRNIYRVLEDDYVPVDQRMAPEEETEWSPNKIQAKMPTRTPLGQSERNTSRGFGMKAGAVIGAIVVVALLISAGLVLGWFDFSGLGAGNGTAQATIVGDPSSIAPTDGSVYDSANVTFAWSSSQNAVDYQFSLVKGSADSSPWEYLTLAGNSYRSSLPDGVYFWKVMAIGEKGSSNWSSVSTFTIRTALDQPTLILPSGNSVARSTTQSYQWRAVDHATLYRLQVDNASDFSSPAIDVLTNRSSYSAEYRYANGGTYYWRVMAYQDGIHSPWSIANAFSVMISLPSPSLGGPADRAIVTAGTVSLNWSVVPDAYAYRLQIDDASNFSSPLRDVVSMGTTYNISGLAVNSTYYWRVMAMNEDYQSAWSGSSFFQGFAYFLRDYSWTYESHTFSLSLNISGASYYAEQQENREGHNNYNVDFGAHVLSSDVALK